MVFKRKAITGFMIAKIIIFKFPVDRVSSAALAANQTSANASL